MTISLIRSKLLTVLAAIACMLALPSTAAAAANKPTSAPNAHASILFFQDGHDIAPVKQGTRDKPEFHGGIARLATVLAAQKARGVPTDIAFGGDLGGGTLFGVLFHGSAMVEAFNTLGVNIAGFGQHDFDYGLDVLRKNVSNSSFPWVSTNLQIAGEPLNGSGNVTAIRTVGGVRIGYLGFTLGMETTTAGKDVSQIDYVSAAKTALPQLAGADVIVALAQFPRAEDAKRLLSEVPQIDVVLREENAFAQEGNDVTMLPDGRFAVAPEGNYGSLARINFAKSPDGKWKTTHEEIQVNADVPEDPSMLALQNKYVEALDKQLATQVACSDKAYAKPQPLGALAAEAFRRAGDAQLGWLNAGGMRAALPAGPLTRKNILAVFPYDNKVMKIKVTGAQLRHALEQGADSSPNGDGGGYPILAGATFTYDADARPGAKISNLKLADGTAVDDSSSFTLALTNYVFNGGNNVTAFKDAEIILDAGFAGSDFDALVAHLAKNGKCDSSGTAGAPHPEPTSSPGADNADQATVRTPEASLSPHSPADPRMTAPRETVNLANTGANIRTLVGGVVLLLTAGFLFRVVSSINQRQREVTGLKGAQRMRSPWR